MVRDEDTLTQTQVVDAGREFDVCAQVGVEQTGEIFVHGRDCAPTISNPREPHKVKLMYFTRDIKLDGGVGILPDHHVVALVEDVLDEDVH